MHSLLLLHSAVSARRLTLKTFCRNPTRRPSVGAAPSLARRVAVVGRRGAQVSGAAAPSAVRSLRPRLHQPGSRYSVFDAPRNQKFQDR